MKNPKVTTTILAVLIVANIAAAGGLYYVYKKSRTGFISQSKLSIEEDRLESAIRTKPDNEKARLLLGKRYLFDKRYDDAIEQFEAALKLEPKYEEALVKLGATYLEMGQADKALKPLLKEIKIAKKQPLAKVNKNLLDSYYFAGKAYLESGKPSKARDILAKGAAMDSKDADIYYFLAKANMDLKKYTDAQKSLDYALRLVPNFSEAMALKAQLYFVQGDKKRAETWNTKALSISPDNAEAKDLAKKL